MGGGRARPRVARPLSPAVVVLDTHVWLWWLSRPEKLSERALDAIERSDSIGISAISCWEVAMLARRGRIALDREPRRWVRQALSRPGLVALALTPKLALDAEDLEEEGFGADPADRMIYATARDCGAVLVTKDSSLRRFDPRGTLW